MRWIYLSIGLIFETVGFVTLKYSENLTKTTPIVLTVAADLTALFFLILALKKFETSFVYMVAAGFGTALIVIANVIIFKQTLNWIQVVSIASIIVGTVGLHSQGTH
jgi:multidrug transporter EmrE-like cation transporter